MRDEKKKNSGSRLNEIGVKTIFCGSDSNGLILDQPGRRQSLIRIIPPFKPFNLATFKLS